MYESKNWLDELVHLYVDGAFSRRDLVRRVARKTGSVATAMTALGAFEIMKAQAPPPPPPGVRVAIDDPDIEARDVTFPGPAGTLFGHFAVPKSTLRELQPGVLVVHENRGLVEHIKDVTRRFAKAGFVSLSVDLLSRQGGVQNFPDPTQQMAAYNRTTQQQRREDLLAGLDYLKFYNRIVFDRIGVTGFCAGGGNVWDFILNFEEVAAAVPFYGTSPITAEDVDRIKTPVLAIYAERDRALTQGMLVTADLMSRRQKVHGVAIYEGAGHGFHNDTGAAYDPASATDAFARTVAFFNKWLRRPR